MTVATKIQGERAAAEIISALLGRKCWRVSCGGSVGTTFQLALGRRLLRHPGVGKRRRTRLSPYEGEFGLLVWCSWRLDSAKGPVTSSDDELGLVEGLKLLEGKRTLRASIPEGWYLRVDFSGGLSLTVFPDHVGDKASFDGNWEAWTPEIHYSVGTDLKCEVSVRQYPPLGFKPRVAAGKWQFVVSTPRRDRSTLVRAAKIRK